MSDNPETKTAITFVKGSGKTIKAQYKIGDVAIPASAITRIIKKIGALEERQQERKFAAALDGKYDLFLDELDRHGIKIFDAVQQIQTLSSKTKKPKNNTRESLMVGSIAKLLARSYIKKSSQEMVQEFLLVTSVPSFLTELIANLDSFEKEFGRSKLGKIRVRKETPDMKGRAAFARDEKEKKEKKGKK